MKVANYLSLLATGLSLLVATAMGETNEPAAGQQSRLVKRLETAAITRQKGAVLFANGKPTTCEIALISNLLGYVAANCLSYMPDGSVDMSKKYQVMISDGTTTSLGMFDVYSATPHFKYDPTTFANNLAFLKFNSGATRQWKNYIGANRADWTSKFYVSRGVNNASPMPAWMPAQAVAESGDITSQCASASPLFAANTNDLVCTSQVVTTSSACALPYSSIYGVRDPDLAVAGLYSHSVIIGDGLCKYTQIYNYYTLLSSYLEWGGNVAKSTIYLYVADLKYVNNNNPNYSMAVPSGKPTGLVVGGDLSGNSPKPSPSSSSTSASPTPTSSTTTTTTTTTSSSTSLSPSSSPTNDSSSGQKTEKSGINIGIILLIVGVVLLVIAIVAYLLFRRYRKRKEQNQINTTRINNEYSDPNEYNLGARKSYNSALGTYQRHDYLNGGINTVNGDKGY